MSLPDVQSKWASALNLHQAGDLPAAQRAYQEILATDPNSADALHNLGLLAHQSGQTEQGIALVRKAIALNPQMAGAYGNLAMLLNHLGRQGEVFEALRAAIARNPSHRDSYFKLAAALRSAGRLDEALVVYDRLLALAPADAAAQFSRGNALRERGALHDAVKAYQQAVQLKPHWVEALLNLGNAFRAIGKAQEAVMPFQRAAELRPDLPDPLEFLGITLVECGRPGEALPMLERSVALNPSSARTHYHRAIAKKATGDTAEAIDAYKRAISLHPQFFEAHFNLGTLLCEQIHWEEGIAALRQAATLNPNEAHVWLNLGNALSDSAQPEAAVEAYHRSLACNPELFLAYSNLVHAAQCLENPDPVLQCAHVQFRPSPTRPWQWAPQRDRSPQRRLKIGYVSGDLRRHSVASFLLPLLQHHDRTQMHITCYSTRDVVDDITARLRQHSDAWRDISPISDEQAAEAIRADEIDILVDLCGHTLGSRLPLFSLRPAPVQVSFLGFPDSTGMPCIQYRLTDALADPPADAPSPSWRPEQLIRLPKTAWCFQPLVDEIAIAPLPAETQPFITFGSFINFSKLSPTTMRMWSTLLHAMPTARLMLKCGAFRFPEPLERVRRQLAEHEIVPPRLELIPGGESQSEHLARYRHLDVALDTFPYHGTTTTCEALWMGVPVVTLAGNRHASRVGASLLTTVGLPDLIAATPEQFVEKAMALAGDLPRLKTLRSTLRQRMQQSPLMDGPGYAQSVEAAYRDMWRHALT